MTSFEEQRNRFGAHAKVAANSSSEMSAAIVEVLPRSVVSIVVALDGSSVVHLCPPVRKLGESKAADGPYRTSRFGTAEFQTTGLVSAAVSIFTLEVLDHEDVGKRQPTMPAEPCT
jgi:hypothetical protein